MAEVSVSSTKHRSPSASQPGRPPLNSLGATPRPPLRQRMSIENSFQFENCLSDEDQEEFTHIRPRHAESPLRQIGRSIALLIFIFLVSALLLRTIYFIFPKVAPEDADFVKYPRDMEDAKSLGRVLSRYSKDHFFRVLVAFFSTYIFLQTFAIPGSIFLSVISGFLFPFPLALLMVCLCSAAGASNCFLLSALVGKPIVQHWIPHRLATWKSHVERHRHNLFNYILFLRITPFLPNWFINIASPVLNVPLTPFFVGTFLGVAPPSFVAIQAGTMLHQLTSTNEVMSYWSMLVLVLFAGLSLLPVFLKEKLRDKFD